MSYKPRACCLIVFASFAVFFSGCTFLPIGKARKRTAAQKNQPQANEPPSVDEQRRVRDSQQAYAKLRKEPKALPQVPDIKGQTAEYATTVYSGVFYEALMNRDFELIDRAADEARASKEKSVAGVWKLEYIYRGLDKPYAATSDREWQRHLKLLKQWSKERPDSRTAKIALATSYFNFGWNARGHDYADKVSEENRKHFSERVDQARNLLVSMRAENPHHVCPKWYSLMLQIANCEGWPRKMYDDVFDYSVRYEPTWYEFYRQKAIYLLPKWNGEPGDLEAYANSYATRNDEDSARIYFLIMQCASAADKNERQKPLAHFAVFKQGFLDMQKTYGVTTLTTIIAFEKAALANDGAFAKEISQLQGQANVARK